MNSADKEISSSVSTVSSNINDERRAHWLLSPYSDSVWTITSSGDPESTHEIDFRFMLADGSSLVDSKRLYATVKEYAWWVRDSRFSRIDSSEYHFSTVSIFLRLTHALTLRKIKSFAHLQPYDIEELVEDCRYGTDGVLRASDRVATHLQKIKDLNILDPKPYGGLPRYAMPSGLMTCSIDFGKIIKDCNLPNKAAARISRVSALIAVEAQKNGFNTPKAKLNIEVPPQTVQTINTIRCWLESFERLYAMRRMIKAEAIGFNPFPYGAVRVANVKGVSGQRTRTPPPKLAIYLLEHSARWLFEQNSESRNLPADIAGINRLTSACWIIIAAFSARRAGEIAELEDGCLRGNKDSGWWLNIHIEKTLQRKEWIPVPILVARAIETMVSISSKARLKGTSNNLFQWKNPEGKVVSLDVTPKLDDFASFVNVPLYTAKDGTSYNWHWHPHQFRRFFAVFYFYRFEGSELEVLSHHLRHFNLEGTKHYITQDVESEALWADVEWGYEAHVARSIVAGERSVSGAAGEKIKKTARRLTNMFRKNVLVTSPDRLGASLKLIMQRQGLVLTPKPWVTCSCPRTRDAALKAACRRGIASDTVETGPDFANAGPSVCYKCPHAITEGSRQSFVDAEVEHLSAAVKSGARAKTLFGALEGSRVVELHRVVESSYEAATPLCLEELIE